jgi:hypothetical protein
MISRHQHIPVSSLGLPPNELRATKDKTRPYITNKYVSTLTNWNFQVDRPDDHEKKLVCRHFVTHFVEESRSDEFKVHNAYKDENSILENLGADIEARCNHVSSHGEYHAVPCANFGHFLEDQFRGMDHGSQKVFMLESGNHSMAFKLTEKPGKSADENKNRYVIEYFDPNMTTIVTRCEVDDLSQLSDGSYDLRSFVNPTLYDKYFSGREECLIIDCTTPSLEKSTKFSDSGRSSASNITDVIVHEALLRDISFSEAHKESFSGMNLQDQEKLLTLSGDDFGHKKGYGSLIFDTLKRGNANVSGDVGNLLSRYSAHCAEQHVDCSKQLNEIVAAKSSEGTPMLTIAIENGMSSSISAYKEMLSKIEPEARAKLNMVELVGAKFSTGNGLLSINYAISKNKHDTIRAYKELLAICTPKERVEIIGNLVNKENRSTFAEILKCCDTETIGEVGEIFALVAPEDRTPIIQSAIQCMGKLSQKSPAQFKQFYEELMVQNKASEAIATVVDPSLRKDGQINAPLLNATRTLLCNSTTWESNEDAMTTLATDYKPRGWFSKSETQEQANKFIEQQKVYVANLREKLNF